MTVKNEYAILCLMLSQIITSGSESERRKLGNRFIKRLAAFTKRIDSIEEKIDAIADRAIAITEKSTKALTVDDMYRIDDLMSAYRDLKLITNREDN